MGKPHIYSATWGWLTLVRFVIWNFISKPSPKLHYYWGIVHSSIVYSLETSDYFKLWVSEHQACGQDLWISLSDHWALLAPLSSFSFWVGLGYYCFRQYQNYSLFDVNLRYSNSWCWIPFLHHVLFYCSSLIYNVIGQLFYLESTMIRIQFFFQYKVQLGTVICKSQTNRSEVVYI